MSQIDYRQRLTERRAGGTPQPAARSTNKPLAVQRSIAAMQVQAHNMAAGFINLTDEERTTAMRDLKKRSSQLHGLVKQILPTLQATQNQSELPDDGVDLSGLIARRAGPPLDLAMQPGVDPVNPAFDDAAIDVNKTGLNEPFENDEEPMLVGQGTDESVDPAVQAASQEPALGESEGKENPGISFP